MAAVLVVLMEGPVAFTLVIPVLPVAVQFFESVTVTVKVYSWLVLPPVTAEVSLEGVEMDIPPELGDTAHA